MYIFLYDKVKHLSSCVEELYYFSWKLSQCTSEYILTLLPLTFMFDKLHKVLQLYLQLSTLQTKESHGPEEFVLLVKSLYKLLSKKDPQHVSSEDDEFNPPILTLFE